jgi:hypothetical protein
MYWKRIGSGVCLASWIVLGLWGAVAGAEGIDILSCGSSTVNVIASGEGFTVLSQETKGINLDNYGNKVFDNMTYQSAVLLKIENGKTNGSLLFKYMDPSGDFFVGETLIGQEWNWKFLYGTGKWKGITGSGKVQPITKGKPITPGTAQACYRITGTYELKK